MRTSTKLLRLLIAVLVPVGVLSLFNTPFLSDDILSHTDGWVALIVYFFGMGLALYLIFSLPRNWSIVGIAVFVLSLVILMRLDPVPPPTEEGTPQYYYEEGLKLSCNWQNDEYVEGLAIMRFNQALHLDPDYAEAYRARGDSYYCKGRYAKAISDYTQAIQIKPDFGRAYNGRASANHALSRERDPNNYYAKLAISDYTEAFRLTPLKPTDDPRRGFFDYQRRGKLYAKVGKYELAIQDYTESIRRVPEGFNSAYEDRADAYDALGNSVEAEKDRAVVDAYREALLSPSRGEWLVAWVFRVILILLVIVPVSWFLIGRFRR